jgi:hypothetical protein
MTYQKPVRSFNTVFKTYHEVTDGVLKQEHRDEGRRSDSARCGWSNPSCHKDARTQQQLLPATLVDACRSIRESNNTYSVK